MATSPFMAAINQICDEKKIAREAVVSTIESALAAAYRKDYGKPGQVIRVSMDPETGKFHPYQIFIVVKKAELKDENSQITITEAKKIQKEPTPKYNDEIKINLPDREEFGRIAAQTAKQVVIQRLREEERKSLYEEFKEKENQLASGVVQQVESGNIIINLGRANAVLPPSEQLPNENYYIGQRIKLLIRDIQDGQRGPQILVSRNKPEFIKSLFTVEVPEIANNAVTIEGIAREAGSRSKMAVHTDDKNIDPIGSCVGQRGTRVQAVLAEIGEEKIDIILWDKEEKKYIINALSPAKVEDVKLNKKNKTAKVTAADDQLSLAIGKGGQNVRLASKLTGWNLDIEKKSGTEDKEVKEDKDSKNKKDDKKKRKNLTKQNNVL